MLEDVDVFASHYVVLEREDGLNRLRVVTLGDGASRHVEFPEPAYDIEAEANFEFDTPGYRFAYQSFITPPTVYEYEAATGKLALLKRQEVLGDYDSRRYQVERLHADRRRRHAGAHLAGRPQGHAARRLEPAAPRRVRRLRPRGLARVLVQSAQPARSRRRPSPSRTCAAAATWASAGTTRAACSRSATPSPTSSPAPSTWSTPGLTPRPTRLVIEGGSAGGLLIGAVLNMRPELFHAALLRVPFVDVINTMLDETLPLTVGEFEEWGNPKVREHYKYMQTYCPYTNLGPRAYPDVLVRTALNDSQVMYWEPAKWVARLRDAQDGRQAAPLQDQHGGRPRRRLRPLRLPARDRLRLRLSPSACSIAPRESTGRGSSST